MGASPPLETPWFAAGVQFSCIPGCRRCCSGDPGDVFVAEADILRLAAHLKLSREEFERTCVRRYASGKVCLRERYNGDCVLLGDDGCEAYAARPQQCRDYPFWPEVMDSPAAWEREKGRCPGLGEGPCHAAASVLAVLESQRQE